MDGSVQYPYPRKNWSSLIVFNCDHPDVQALTPEIVNQAEPAFLHRFSWLKDDAIGELDKGWNYLEGWYPPEYKHVKAIHYTLGGPWFKHKSNCDFASLWLDEHSKLLSIQQQKYA
jgi:hypothetical protein